MLGYKNDNILFLELPFYKTKKITYDDFHIIGNLLEKVNPEHIFVCNDSDPNKTHNKCYEIILGSNLNVNLKYVWLYNSAWGEWKNKKDVNCVSYLDEENFNRKRLSIMMHDSQDPPKVFYEDNRPFYDKIINKNSSELNPGYYEEQFKVITKEEFKNI